MRLMEPTIMLSLVQVRKVVADFALVIAIAAMTVIDLVFALRTPKLFVPDEFKVSTLLL